jgi:predicted transposase YbfD/YdcC
LPNSSWSLFPPEHETVEKGHGRLETRSIYTQVIEKTDDQVLPSVHFAYAKQVACVRREVYDTTKNKTRSETVYLITSLPPAQANAQKLLALNRGHWAIENRLHCVRDMAFDEDRCRARKGNTPHSLACLRNFALSLMRLMGVQNIKSHLRTLAANAARVLQMLHL